MYIRRIDNPLVVKAFGSVSSGGLGDFDTDIYEEIEGRPPSGYILEQILTNDDIIKESRKAMLTAYKMAPIELRVAFEQVILTISGLLDLEDYARAKQLAENVDTSIIENAEHKILADSLKSFFVSKLDILQEF